MIAYIIPYIPYINIFYANFAVASSDRTGDSFHLSVHHRSESLSWVERSITGSSRKSLDRVIVRKYPAYIPHIRYLARAVRIYGGQRDTIFFTYKAVYIRAYIRVYIPNTGAEGV